MNRREASSAVQSDRRFPRGRKGDQGRHDQGEEGEWTHGIVGLGFHPLHSKRRADKTIFFVDYESRADLKIFFVDYESRAGWRNKSKQHLLY